MQHCLAVVVKDKLNSVAGDDLGGGATPAHVDGDERHADDHADQEGK